MISHDLDGALRVTLSAPMTTKQRQTLEASLRERLAQNEQPVHHVRPHTVALLLAMLLVAAPAVFAVSAALRSTESPNGSASAAAFQAELDAAKQAVPLPAGATWPPYLTASDKGESYSAGGGRTWVEFVAFCAWDHSWLDATAAGDSLNATATRKTIREMPTWEFYRGEFATDSFRSSVDQIVAAVGAGDRGPVEEFVRVNCAG